MRVLLSLCAVLVLLWSTVQCRPRHDHSHHGNDHSHHDNDHSHHDNDHSHHGNNDFSISANGSLKIYQDNIDFAFHLYKHISAQPDSQSKNVFFSPLSVSMALAALSVGARGKTQQQLFEGLGFNSTEITTEEVSQAFQHILHNLTEETDVDLSLGNALFIGQDFKPRPEFLESMKRYFESDVFSTDFNKTEEAKEQINKYVNEKTKGKISDLVQDVDPLTVMYIINYIYFKGKWQIPFDPKATKEHDFHVDDKTNVSVPMMYGEDYFNAYQDEDVSFLQLQYNESVAMMLLLPEKGLQGLEEVVCKNHLQKWKTSMEKKKYQVYVPKLSLKTSYQLKEILSEMGITDIFGNTADLTGISEESKLAVSKVMHKATLDVDEAGATAAASTGIGVRANSAQFPAHTPVLKFDRPFMFLVVNRDSSIMFMGTIVNPAE
ncbi:alpha-1-antitrypsin-like [Conger conger]|uniref:alpha-1-antitrypsin-like n=1 Tax=Conger conger TaxID=82655 RepID=UPI002A5AE9EA|nr:alpha-1-antitrypsin-like [Conger conger]